MQNIGRLYTIKQYSATLNDYIDSIGKERNAEIHWFEHDEIGQVKFKIKKGDYMKAIWHGENDEFGLLEGKEYDILSVELKGYMYDVVDETGDDYLYPAEDFEITEQ